MEENFRPQKGKVNVGLVKQFNFLFYFPINFFFSNETLHSMRLSFHIKSQASPFVSLSVSSTVCLSVRPFVCLSIQILQFVYLFVYFFVCLSVCLFVCHFCLAFHFVLTKLKLKLKLDSSDWEWTCQNKSLTLNSLML